MNFDQLKNYLPTLQLKKFVVKNPLVRIFNLYLFLCRYLAAIFIFANHCGVMSFGNGKLFGETEASPFTAAVIKSELCQVHLKL